MPATITALDAYFLKANNTVGNSVVVVVEATWTGSPITSETVDIEIRDSGNSVLLTASDVPFDKNGVAVAKFDNAATTWNHARADWNSGMVTDTSGTLTVASQTASDWKVVITPRENDQVLDRTVNFTVVVTDNAAAKVLGYLFSASIYTFEPDKGWYAVDENASTMNSASIDESGEGHFCIRLDESFEDAYVLVQVEANSFDMDGVNGRSEATFLPKDVGRTWSSTGASAAERRTNYKATIPWVGTRTEMLVPMPKHVTEFDSPGTTFFDDFTVSNVVGGGAVTVTKVIRPSGVYAKATRTGTVTSFDLTIKAFGGWVRTP